MTGREQHNKNTVNHKPKRRPSWWARLRPEERRAINTLGLLCAGVLLFGLSIELGAYLHHLLSS